MSAEISETADALTEVGADAPHTDRTKAPETIAHAVTRDLRAQIGKKPADIAFLRHAQRRSGRHPLALAREYLRLKRGRGKLTLPEYVQFGVYDTARLDADAQSRFITNTLHWPITHRCCDMTWQAATEDKYLCARILADSGVPVPETLAVIDKGGRLYPGARRIATAAEFRDFVNGPDFVPFFAKENRGIASFGAFVVAEPDPKAVRLKGERALDYDTFMGRFVGDTAYLIQRLERNHPFFDKYTDSLATVRMCVLLAADGVRIPFAVLKIPSRRNLADSFWRPGNLACHVDVASGRILRARSRDDLGTTDHDTHPETGAALPGETVPMWRELVDLVHRCAPIFQPVRYQSMDIAVTPDGPVLIEINTGGGFDLPQLASGEGFLTDEIIAFFNSCGYPIP